ncbi:hypothetical protein DdX_14015 [Ditylenchus destructor]|uniref:Uncharacterized protein n=1 Tax=Ditylenchus destructor TaxID=166010 RepID=A0AAD4MXT3_9BILA|nr:hypothetical protein DdX_14015 [Ditylenchus destructor]
MFRLYLFTGVISTIIAVDAGGIPNGEKETSKRVQKDIQIVNYNDPEENLGRFKVQEDLIYDGAIFQEAVKGAVARSQKVDYNDVLIHFIVKNVGDACDEGFNAWRKYAGRDIDTLKVYYYVKGDLDSGYGLFYDNSLKDVVKAYEDEKKQRILRAKKELLKKDNNQG